MAADDAAWDGGWEANAAAQRRAWAATDPATRLAWLEDALELALASGALARDRRRRASQTWPAGSSPGTARQADGH